VWSATLIKNSKYYWLVNHDFFEFVLCGGRDKRAFLFWRRLVCFRGSIGWVLLPDRMPA
jgi:hypothetical protein